LSTTCKRTKTQNLNGKLETTERLMKSYWKAAGHLLGDWQYNRLSQRNPKATKHEKRQKYARTSKAIGLEAYKQTW